MRKERRKIGIIRLAMEQLSYIEFMHFPLPEQEKIYQVKNLLAELEDSLLIYDNFEDDTIEIDIHDLETEQQQGTTQQ